MIMKIALARPQPPPHPTHPNTPPHPTLPHTPQHPHPHPTAHQLFVQQLVHVYIKDSTSLPLCAGIHHGPVPKPVVRITFSLHDVIVTYSVNQDSDEGLRMPLFI